MLSVIRDLRVSSAVVGEKRSFLLGVLDLSGFPANAWEFRFMDMVVVMLRKERWVVICEMFLWKEIKEKNFEDCRSFTIIFFHGGIRSFHGKNKIKVKYEN